MTIFVELSDPRYLRKTSNTGSRLLPSSVLRYVTRGGTVGSTSRSTSPCSTRAFNSLESTFRDIPTTRLCRSAYQRSLLISSHSTSIVHLPPTVSMVVRMSPVLSLACPTARLAADLNVASSQPAVYQAG